jgi:hypothetical protein
MYLSGNPRIAIDFNVNAAIFIQKLAEWTFLNLANKKHLHDGHCWSYNTLEAYEEIFPWWSKRQLETIINNAVKDGLVVKGNYNSHKYDRTSWYALTIKALIYYPELTTEKHLLTLAESISPNCEMYDINKSHEENVIFHFTEWGNAVNENVTTIPTTNTTNINISKDILGKVPKDVNGTVKTKKKGAFGINELLADNPHQIEQPVLEDWLEVRKAKRNKVTFTAWKNINQTLKDINDKLSITPQKAFETMVTKGWQSLEVDYFVKAQPRSQKTVDDFPNYI